MSLLTTHQLSKSYSGASETRLLFEDLSLSVDKEEFIGITGPSGCGKSTLLNILSSLDTPSQGHVVFDGTQIDRLGDTELAKLRNQHFGFVFQTPHHLPTKTVLENVLLPLQYQGSPILKSQRVRAQSLLASVDLKHCQNRLPTFLSGGELQRMVFVRAIVNHPEIIFADEPTGSLDRENAITILELLRAETKKETSVIMVSHDSSAIEYCTRSIALDQQR